MLLCSEMLRFFLDGEGGFFFRFRVGVSFFIRISIVISISFFFRYEDWRVDLIGRVGFRGGLELEGKGSCFSECLSRRELREVKGKSFIFEVEG